MDFIYLISIILEVIAGLLGIALAVKKKKSYGWCIAIAFAAWVIYDLAKANLIALPANLLAWLFILAAVSITWAVLKVYKEA